MSGTASPTAWSFEDLYGTTAVPAAPGAEAPQAEPTAWSFDELFAPKQSLPAAVGNAAMQGLIGGVGQGIAGPARMLQAAEKGWADTMLHAVGMLAFDEGAAYRALTPMQRGVLTAYRRATPERQAEMQAEWQGALAQGTPAMVDAGTAISQYGQTFRVAPEQEGTMTGAARMAGALPPALLAGGIGAVAAGPVGGIAGMTAAMFGQAYESTYQTAREKGATEDQALEAATKNAVVQSAANVVPLTRVMNNIPAPLRDKFVRTIAKIGQSGLEFAGANALGRFAENFVLRETVDPAIDLAEGVWDDAKAGALLGAVIPGAAMAGRGAGRAVRNQLGQAASPEFRADLDRTERLADEAQPTIAPEAVPVDGLPPDLPGGEPSTPAQGTIPLQFDPNIPTMRITPEPEAPDGPLPAWQVENAAAIRDLLAKAPAIGEQIKALHGEGKTASEIAAELGGGWSTNDIRAARDALGLVPHGPAVGLLGKIPESGTPPDGVPEGPMQETLPAEMGRPAEDVAPAPDAPDFPVAGGKFTTAKGSSYVVHEDGTTTRDKAYRPEHGEKEQGPQPRSERTFYVSAEDALKLAEFQTQGSKKEIVIDRGHAAIRYVDGPSAGKIERRTVVPFETAPRPGLTPVELWKDGKVVHFGNEIVAYEARPAMPPPMADLRRPAKPPSLFDFLISKGGIRPDGDLIALGLNTVHHQRAGRLLNKNGMTVDRAREVAAHYLRTGRDDGGRYGERTEGDVADFYDALAEEHAGRPVYPPEYASEANEWAQGRAADRERIRGEELAVEARAVAEEGGIRLTPDEEMHAARLMVEGARPEEAVYEAVRASDVERTQAYNEARGMLSAREKGQADQRAIGAPSPEAGRARQELAVVMQRLMRQAGLPSAVGLKLVDRLADAEGNAADASYARSLVTFALDTPAREAPTKLFHEVTHALMDPQLGVLTQTQRNALLRAADRWLAQAGNREGLADLRYTPEQMREEAVARVAEEVVTKARREAPITTRAVEAMNRAVEAIGSGLRGQGFWSADGVFRAVMQGRVKGEGKGGADGSPQYARRPLPESLDPQLPAAGGLKENLEKRNVSILSAEVTAHAARFTSPEGREYGALLDAQRQAWSRVDWLRASVELDKANLRDPSLTDRGAERKYGTLQRNQAKLENAEASAAALGVDPDAPFPGDARMDVPFGEFPGDREYAHESYAPEGFPFPDLSVPEDKRHQYHDPRHRVRQGDTPADESPLYARRPPKPPPSGPDLFGGERRDPEQRAAVPTYRTDPRQEAMPGMEPSAVQAQAARDQTGRGGLEPRVPQARPDEGLFAAKAPEEGTLLSRRRPRGDADETPQPNLPGSGRPAPVGQNGPQPRPAAGQGKLDASRSAWEIEDPGLVDSFLRAFVNKTVDLDAVQKRIEKVFGPVPEGRNASLKETNYHGRVSSRVQRLHDQRVKPILRQIADNREGVTVDDVDRYLLARHAPERNKAMKEINPDRVDNEALSGMSDADAAAAMQAFAGESKLNRLEAIAKDVDKLTADTRKVIKAEGLETADTIKAWEDAYQFYAPLQRDIEGNGSPKGSGFNVRGPESKRSMGSTLEVKNILANIVAQAETAAIRAEKNKVTTALADLAKQYPADGFWKVDEVPTTRQINKDTGLVEVIPDPLYQLAPNVVMYKEGGKHHFIEFNEKNKRAMEVARGMKNMDAAQRGLFSKIIGWPARFMSQLLTRYYPEFWMTNFIRDMGGAQFNLFGTDMKGGRREMIANVPKAMRGLRDLYRGEGNSEWARYAKEMDAAGGTTGYMDMYETSDKRMNNLKSEVAKLQQGKADPRRLARETLKVIDDYNSIVENSVRLAAFQAARKQGLSTEKAARVAKNITVNFNRKGNLSSALNDWFMFFNASAQGTAVTLKAAATSPKARAIVGGMAAIGFLLDMVNRELIEDYDQIEDFKKAHNAFIPTGGKNYIQIPYPLGMNAIFNVGRLTSEALSGQSHKEPIEYAASMGLAMLDAFNPLGSVGSIGQLVAPSAFRPVVQAVENKSFTGAPVYKSGDRGPRGDAPEPAHRRHFQNTPEMWIAASRGLNALTGGDFVEQGAINVSPDALRHIFTSMTGGPGRSFDRTVDYFTTDEPSISRLPFAGRLIGKVDERAKEQAYYKESKIINTAINKVDLLLRSGRPEAADNIIKKLGKGDLDEGFRILGSYRAAKKELDTLRRKEAPVRMTEPTEEDTAIIRMMLEMRRQSMGRALREGRP